MKKFLLPFIFASSFVSAQVANDECADATTLNVSTFTTCTTGASGTLQESTVSGGTLTCTESASFDVWYQFVATNQRHGITISDVTGIGTSLRFEMYEGSCSASSIYCGFSGPSHFPTSLTVGQTYFLRVYPSTSTVNQNITFNICITVPGSAITTSDSNYTINELVDDVLINSEGIIVSNIASSTGTNFGSVNGIGYFNNNETNFTLTEGIILSTGSITTAPGPNTGPSSGGNNTWPGDTDLYNILTDQSTATTFNASSLEFDFVANGDMLIIDYIFASEEYGIFQCNVNDSFAIILTDLSTGTQQNIALIPGTTIPVSVATVRNMVYNSNCLSSNPQYFGTYYAPTSTTSPVNFNGLTVPLTAEAAIIPDTNYHIKFVIADRMDPVIDSALFIGGFAVYTGEPDLGEPNDLSSCDDNNDDVALFDLTMNTPVLLGDLDPDEYTVTYHETIFDAQNNQNSISNTQAYLNVGTLTSGGEQVIYARVTNNNYSSIYAVSSFSLIIQPKPVTGEVSPIVMLDTDMDLFTNIDLTTKESEILYYENSFGFTISYYTIEQDALAAVNPIADATLFYTTNITIFYRLENNATGCFTIGSFDIIVLPADYETPAPEGPNNQTFTPGQTLADLEVEGENIQWYATAGSGTGRNVNDDNVPLPVTTPLVDNTTYHASQTINGIESVERLPVTVHAALATTEFAFTGLQYYPNPVKDVLSMDNAEEIGNVVIYNMIGQIVANKNINATSAEIDLSSLSDGIYMIKVTSKGQEKSFKIVRE